jgi:tetratricopeptide (TPR) repeat protein
MLGGIWQFLKDPTSFALLGSIGAGIATIAAGAWAVFTYFDKKKEKGPSAPSVAADHGSVAAGRDITAPVTVGLNEKGVRHELRKAQEPLRDELERLAAQVARDKGVEITPLHAVLVKLGEKGVPEEDIPKRLDSAADELIKLRAENEQLRRGPPALAAIAEEVQALVDKGEFEDARRALARGREAARALRVDASRYEAAFLAQEARVDDLQLAYRSAAAKFAEAAGLVGPFDTEQQWRFLLAQAGELYKQGDEFGDNAALTEAIDIYRRCLALAPRSERPLDWARTQANLGNALLRLGERESGTAHLEGAVSAYREALQELTRERVPLDWAKAQICLGIAIRRLGERESGTARLEEAVAAFREALQENTRARVPLDWAMTQIHLGNALARLGEREGGTARLEEAVAAFREALQENFRARVPLQWAATQTNLGNALGALGEWESGTARLEEAVEAYREALQELTRARVPLEWATAQMNLGNALRALGEREGGTGKLEEAIAAYRETLQEFTRERVPLQWAATQTNLAVVYWALFAKDRPPSRRGTRSRRWRIGGISQGKRGFRHRECRAPARSNPRSERKIVAASRSCGLAAAKKTHAANVRLLKPSIVPKCFFGAAGPARVTQVCRTRRRLAFSLRAYFACGNMAARNEDF